MPGQYSRCRSDLEKSYGKNLFPLWEKEASLWFPELERIMKVNYAYKTPEMIAWEKDFVPEERFTEKDVILITYGDLIQSQDCLPLEILADFSETYLKGAINTLHILPFSVFIGSRIFHY